MQIKIYDIATGEVIERELTKNELLQYEADQIEIAAARTEAAAKSAAKAALLDRLGITADEAQLLLS